MDKKERSSNDQRSDVKNSNNDEYQKDKLNTSQQQAAQDRNDRLADIAMDYPWLFSDND
jgi:hypothetical protein